MKRTIGALLAILFLAAPSVWAKHKSSAKDESGKQGHAHKKSTKGKKGKGASKGDSGANMESEITSGDVKFNSKGGSK